MSSEELLREARPDQYSLENHRKVVDFLVRFLQHNSPFVVSEVVESGSLGQGTTTSRDVDIDLVVLSQSLPKDNHPTWLPGILSQLETALKRGSEGQPPHVSQMSHQMREKAIPRCHSWIITRFALQFNCGGYDVDLLPTYDWSRDPGGYQAFYRMCAANQGEQKFQWYSRGAAKLQVEFVSHQSNDVKDLIRIVKFWVKTRVVWSHRCKPSSYLITLLVIRAAENSSSWQMDKIRVLSEFCRIVRQDRIRISWGNYYNPDDYIYIFPAKVQRVVQDPANPFNNVAVSGIGDWSEFSRKVTEFERELNPASARHW
eukprot:m.19287 g.19287  ORF g.19287 m.19287 type:complete len:315 (+) comp27818_c0_seq3:179-1123(+)